MPVEALQRPLRQPTRTAVAATPPRLRPKGPVGPDFYRQSPAAETRPRQSAVERLEADKAKYVKSQVALTKQPPLKPPETRKPPQIASTVLRPTRKTPAQTKPRQESLQLDLDHLTSLISDVSSEPVSSPTVSSVDSDEQNCSTPTRGPPSQTRPKPDRPTDWSSFAKVRLKASGPDAAEGSASPGPPAAGTVRRVDVKPQPSSARTPTRPAQFMRQPLQPIPLHSQFLLRPSVSHLRLFYPRTSPGPSPLKPVVGPAKPDNPASSPSPTPVPAPPSLSPPGFPPPSPAVTRLSSSSSRKRPSLTRSKSDMSDRCSRAGTELERFFNLCGLDPVDLQDLTESHSDIVSMARFRSVSAPGSECVASGRQDNEEDEDEDVPAAARVPYGVSVIERNARVIKWLYGLGQSRDGGNKSAIV